MKLGAWALALVPVLSAFTACGDDFETCEASRTCKGDEEQGGGGHVASGGDSAGTDGLVVSPDGGSDDSPIGGSSGAVVPEAGAGGFGGGGETPASCTGIDTNVDPLNCGKCGHDCLGGDCALGVCQPVFLAKDQGRYIKLTSDPEYIYWTGDGATIGRVKADGSAEAEELIPQSAGELGYDNVVVGKTLYWGNDWNDNGVRGCALPACTSPKTVVPGTLPLDAIHYDAASKRLFWNQGNVIWNAALPAGASEIFLTTDSRVRDLDTDGSFVYWTEYDPVKKITKVRKRSKNGGSATLLAQTVDAYYSRVFGGRMYLVDGPEAGLHVIPLPNGVGSAATDAFAPSKDVSAIAADSDGVYWAERVQNEGTLRSCPHSGCVGVPTIKGSSSTIVSILTDQRAIYWGTDDGAVLKVAK
jgi:hypothetical protein